MDRAPATPDRPSGSVRGAVLVDYHAAVGVDPDVVAVHHERDGHGVVDLPVAADEGVQIVGTTWS